MRELEGIVDKRKTILSNAGVLDIYTYNTAHPTDPLPGIVVVIDNFAEFKETFGGDKDDVETVLDKFVILARECKPYGVHLLLTVNQLSVLSTQLYNIFTERYTLKLGDAGDYRAIVGASVPEIADIQGRGYVNLNRMPLSFQVATPTDLLRTGTADATNENQDLVHLAENMHKFIKESGRSFRHPLLIGALPKAVLLKQMLAREHGLVLDETFLPQLKDITRRRWAESLVPENTDWLRVTFGLVSGNRPCEMKLEAKLDGVHGVIAGGTGSGKSELLMTLIVGLALRYDPSVLNFVLVDFKGGGACPVRDAAPLRGHHYQPQPGRRPAHVHRHPRRNRAPAEAHHRDRNQRYRRLSAGGPSPDPCAAAASLLIIDEYAEMIAESPEFKTELESITRAGRSAGINLLLAAQRPTGITDQMRANIKFRVCLRVEETETSREMLRRSDAAFLPNGMPGRGYLQVGNEDIELMQTAYTGDTYPYAPLREGDRAQVL